MDLEGVPEGCQLSHRKPRLHFLLCYITLYMAVSLDVNAEAACGPIKTEEELSLFFLIRDSNASGKSSTG